LHHVFRIFAVLRDVLRNSKDIAVVPPNQLLEGADVAGLGRMNQG